jgi:hypothetical protein
MQDTSRLWLSAFIGKSLEKETKLAGLDLPKTASPLPLEKLLPTHCRLLLP